MPIHSFEDPATGQTIDVYVPASAPTSEHTQQTVDGKVYKRVYSAPLAAVDIGLGDATPQDFARKTNSAKKGLKVGDLWEISAEMRAKREQRDGQDAVTQQYYQRYEEETGEKHQDVVRREKLERANAQLGEWGIKVSM